MKVDIVWGVKVGRQTWHLLQHHSRVEMNDDNDFNLQNSCNRVVNDVMHIF